MYRSCSLQEFAYALQQVCLHIFWYCGSGFWCDLCHQLVNCDLLKTLIVHMHIDGICGELETLNSRIRTGFLKKLTFLLMSSLHSSLSASLQPHCRSLSLSMSFKRSFSPLSISRCMIVALTASSFRLCSTSCALRCESGRTSGSVPLPWALAYCEKVLILTLPCCVPQCVGRLLLAGSPKGVVTQAMDKLEYQSAIFVLGL